MRVFPLHPLRFSLGSHVSRLLIVVQNDQILELAKISSQIWFAVHVQRVVGSYDRKTSGEFNAVLVSLAAPISSSSTILSEVACDRMHDVFCI